MFLRSWHARVHIQTDCAARQRHNSRTHSRPQRAYLQGWTRCSTRAPRNACSSHRILTSKFPKLFKVHFPGPSYRSVTHTICPGVVSSYTNFVFSFHVFHHLASGQGEGVVPSPPLNPLSTNYLFTRITKFQDFQKLWPKTFAGMERAPQFSPIL